MLTRTFSAPISTGGDMTFKIIGCIFIAISAVSVWNVIPALEDYPERTSEKVYERARVILIVFSALWIVGLLMLGSVSIMLAVIGLVAVIWSLLEGRPGGMKLGVAVATFGVALHYAWIF